MKRQPEKESDAPKDAATNKDERILMTNKPKVNKNLSENKHSPLPWHVDYYPSRGIEIRAVVKGFNKGEPVKLFHGPADNDVSFGLNKEGNLIARIVYEEWTDPFIGKDFEGMQQANADLIVRAVNNHKPYTDLLKRLETLIFSMLEGYSPTVVQYNQILNEISKVLPDAGEK